ncbi:MAG TPA: hypothetical protein VK211_04925 [Kamptonema sp.]|nr:hypothetical protein [Kamptonema sp.]
MNTDTVAAIASIIVLGAAIWAASVVLETVAKIVNKLIGVTVAIALLLIYLKFSWGIEPVSLWHSLQQLPQAFNFSTSISLLPI